MPKKVTTSSPAPAALDLSQAKELILFAKEHKILSLKLGEMEIVFDPGAFTRGVPIKELKFTQEQLAEQAKREFERTAYRSA